MPHEQRPCYRCDRGRIYKPATIHGGRGEWAPCPECAGKGSKLTFVYLMQHELQRRGRR